jgi:hypothetical protein
MSGNEIVRVLEPVGTWFVKCNRNCKQPGSERCYLNLNLTIGIGNTPLRSYYTCDAPQSPQIDDPNITPHGRICLIRHPDIDTNEKITTFSELRRNLGIT